VIRNTALICLAGACVGLAGSGVFFDAWAADAPVAKKEEPVLSDDPLLRIPPPLDPARKRTEAEEDKLTASTLFLRGRLAFQREDYERALQSYQRAWRYDPEAVSILREIVPLAFRLERNAVAARYAVIMAEIAPRDAVLLRRLAQHLMDQRDYGRALKLYEQSLKLRSDGEDGDAEKDAREVLSQMEIARLYFLEEQYQKAAEAFAVVRDALANPEEYDLSDKVHTTLRGNPRVTYTLIAESFLKAGRLEEAAEMFEKAMSDEASAPLLAFHLARIEMANGRARAALDQVEKYISAAESSAGTRPYALLEEALQELNDDEEAQQKLRKRLEQAHRDDADNAPLTYFLADKYAAWGELDKAATLLESVLESDPTISGYADLIDVYRRQQKPEKLVDALAGAIEQTGSFRPLEEQIDALAEEKKLIRKLFAALEKRQEKADGQPGPYAAFAMGLLGIEAEMFDRAEPQLEIAAANDEQRRAAILESWGLQMFLAGEYDRAAKVFQRAIDENVAEKFNADFYYYLAAALEFGGKTDPALEAARRAAEEKPDSPRYASRYAWVLYHAGRYDEAEQAYRKLLQEYDDDHSSEDVRDVMREARMILSNIAVQQGRMPQAEEWLLQVLDEYPEDIGALNDLGYLWADQGKHLQRSLEMVQTAVAGEPDNAAYLDSLGWAHFRLGNYKEAVEHLERAAAGMEETPDGVILDHLGDAYVAVGRNDDAAEAYRRAVELFQQDDKPEQAQKTQKKLDKLQSSN